MDYKAKYLKCLKTIAGRIHGINYDALTTAEKQIVGDLEIAGIMTRQINEYDENICVLREIEEA